MHLDNYIHDIDSYHNWEVAFLTSIPASTQLQCAKRERNCHLSSLATNATAPLRLERSTRVAIPELRVSCGRGGSSVVLFRGASPAIRTSGDYQ